MPLPNQPRMTGARPSKLSRRSGYFVPLAAGIGAASLAVACERITFYSTGRPSSASAATETGSGASASSGGSQAITRALVLDALSSCTTELLGEFRAAADELNVAAAAAKDDPAAQEKARAAWTKAVDIWQKAELFQFGPAGPNTTPGGKSLREYIYSWPIVSRCLIEQSITEKAYENPTFVASSLVNMRGLAASEYLLFYTGTDNACTPASGINASGQWAALSPAELAVRKARYASAVADDLAKSARTLADAWSPASGDFKAQVANAGSSGSVYTTDQMALNAVSDAMFYIETHVKDVKLARPLGILNCDTATCPEAVESRFAGRSRQHIRNNLLGFRMLLSGCDAGKGVGFDDLLASAGASPLAEKLGADVDEAILAVDAIKTEDLAKALAEDLASVQKLHVALKKLTDVLKTEFVSVLDLELPKQLEGDND